MKLLLAGLLAGLCLTLNAEAKPNPNGNAP